MRQLQPLHRPRLACIQAASADGPEADPVDVAAKGEERQKLFNRIAPAYDELNDLLSLGQHRIWKRMAVGWSRASAGNSVLDVCCGSGDLALLLAGTVGPEGSVVGLDFAQNMLDYAATREREKVSCRRGCSIQWLKVHSVPTDLDR
jgi:demethylmenaquinone methyltransferase/2-methoxy-6-polyprenyl-1,4-benzoquinol methylase